MARPILPWRSPLVLLPPAASLVWIRRLPFYDTPVRATSGGLLGFTVPVPTTTAPNQSTDYIVPVSAVHSWKFQFLADEQAYLAVRQPGNPR